MILYQLRKDQETVPELATLMDNGLYADPISVGDAKLGRFLERHQDKKYFVEIIDTTTGRALGFYKVPMTFNCNDVIEMSKQVQEARYIVREERLKAPKLFGAALKSFRKKQEAANEVSGPKLETIEDKPVVFNGLVFNIGG